MFWESMQESQIVRTTYISLSACGKIPWRSSREKVCAWRSEVVGGGGLVGEPGSELEDKWR